MLLNVYCSSFSVITDRTFDSLMIIFNKNKVEAFD